MQTSLYKITFNDGRVFKVFCANRKQNRDMLSLITQMGKEQKLKSMGIEVVAVGIHTFKQFEDIISKN